MGQNLGLPSPWPAFVINVELSRSPFNIQPRIDLVFPPSRISVPPSVPFAIRRHRVVFHRGKRDSSRQPFVTVPYLNCFHGFPFRSIHTADVLPLVFSVAVLCSTNLNYPEGCVSSHVDAVRTLSFSFSLSLAYFKSTGWYPAIRLARMV